MKTEWNHLKSRQKLVFQNGKKLKLNFFLFIIYYCFFKDLMTTDVLFKTMKVVTAVMDLIHVNNNFHFEHDTARKFSVLRQPCYKQLKHEPSSGNGQKCPKCVFIKNVLGYSWHLRGSQQLWLIQYGLEMSSYLVSEL